MILPGGWEPIFSADSIGRRFGTRRVLTSATVWARPGEITALLGRNGEGKTTLLRIAAGLLRPHHGHVRLRGRRVAGARLHRLAREGLFYLPQEGLLPRGRTVRELARATARVGNEAPASHHDGSGPASATTESAAEAESRLATWADRWDLTHLLDVPADALSGGERNRTGVALALLRGPAVLLADEPLTGAAPRDGAAILAALRRLRMGGCAVVVTGHEARELMVTVDRIVWLVAGTTRDLGPPEEALLSDQFRTEYLGPGYPAEETAGPISSEHGEST